MAGIAGVVILYYPDDSLIDRINTYLGWLDKLYVFDNSEHPHPFVFSGEKLVYVSEKVNKGIAERLNQAAELAMKDGFEFLLTMDQDSYFDGNNMLNYLNCIKNFPFLETTGMFGVEFQDRAKQNAACTVIETTLMITSGSIINLKLFRLIGSFDEALFIDQVDIDFCYKIVSKGYKIIQFSNIYMHHSLGNIASYRSLTGFGKSKRSLHSPVRLYYMTRNFLYMRDKYRKQFPDEMLHIKKDLLNRIKNNILYGKRRMAVIGNILSALVDYKQGKMGKKK